LSVAGHSPLASESTISTLFESHHVSGPLDLRKLDAVTADRAPDSKRWRIESIREI